MGVPLATWGQPAPPAKKTDGEPPQKQTARGGSLLPIGARESPFPPRESGCNRKNERGGPGHSKSPQQASPPRRPQALLPPETPEPLHGTGQRAELQQEVPSRKSLLPARLGCSSPAQRQQGSEGHGEETRSHPFPTSQQPAAQPKKNVLCSLKQHQRGPAGALVTPDQANRNNSRKTLKTTVAGATARENRPRTAC